MRVGKGKVVVAVALAAAILLGGTPAAVAVAVDATCTVEVHSEDTGCDSAVVGEGATSLETPEPITGESKKDPAKQPEPGAEPELPLATPDPSSVSEPEATREDPSSAGEPEVAPSVKPEPEPEPEFEATDESELRVAVSAPRSVPVMGACGFITLPNGLDANVLRDIMSTATAIPVTSDGIKVTAYVTQKSFESDLGGGPFEQHQVDIYVIPELPYDSVSIRGKTGWASGEAPHLQELFKARNYTIDLDALLATPELTKAGATGLDFTDQGFPEFDVTIGPDLTISTALLQFLGIQSGNEERPRVNALVGVMPLPAECETPVVEDPPVLEEPTPQPSVEPTPRQDAPAPRAVPESIQTGVGPESASALASPDLPALSGGAAVREWQDLTLRELLELLQSAREETPPALSLPGPRPMPFSNVLEPSTFNELWVIEDAANGYTADGPQYFLAHTHTQGGAVGNAVNEAGLTPGFVIEVAGVRYDVTGVATVAKPDIGTLPMWQSRDPDDAYLVVCLWHNGVRATHNLVIELHRS